MSNNFLTIVKSLSKWRIVMILLLSTLLTAITTYLFSRFFEYLVMDSLTLSSLNFALVDIIGYSKYISISNFIYRFSYIFILLIFILYMHLFYRREKKMQYIRDLRKIINETQYMAEGNFDIQIQTQNHQDLDMLASNINAVVLQLKNAIADERQIEHTKNELITNVSHDLRTPLTSIVGYLRLIEQDKYRDEVALRHYTSIAYEKAMRLENLMNELFEYTRMQDKNFKLRKDPINLTELIAQITTQYQIHFTENNLNCRENISSVKALVLGDGDRLARVFDNLISNAINYGKHGKYVDISAEEDEENVVVAVTNYGNVIPSIDLPHIFERFYRTEKSRSTYTGGSGLGLAIAKSIIILHGGTIDVISDFEKTSFIVKLKKLGETNS